MVLVCARSCSRCARGLGMPPVAHTAVAGLGCKPDTAYCPLISSQCTYLRVSPSSSLAVAQNPAPGGPYLQFLGYDLASKQWRGSLLMVLGCFQEPAPVPTLNLEDEGEHPLLTVLGRLGSSSLGVLCWLWSCAGSADPGSCHTVLAQLQARHAKDLLLWLSARGTRPARLLG